MDKGVQEEKKRYLQISEEKSVDEKKFILHSSYREH